MTKKANQKNSLILENKHWELPLFLNNLTSIDLSESIYKYDARIMPSKFYDTNKHLLKYPYKTII